MSLLDGVQYIVEILDSGYEPGVVGNDSLPSLALATHPFPPRKHRDNGCSVSLRPRMRDEFYILLQQQQQQTTTI
jgi:hypothetical protein